METRETLIAKLRRSGVEFTDEQLKTVADTLEQLQSSGAVISIKGKPGAVIVEGSDVSFLSSAALITNASDRISLPSVFGPVSPRSHIAPVARETLDLISERSFPIDDDLLPANRRSKFDPKFDPVPLPPQYKRHR
jgi:hypothetical protein